MLSKEVSRAVLSDWRARLYDKAKSTQIKLLQDFGQVAKGTDFMSSGLDEPREPYCGIRILSARDQLASPEPQCICGSSWERIDKRERISRLLKDTEPGWRSWTPEEEQRVESLAMGSLVTCDLCTEPAMRSGFLWTCKKGPHTLLHPAAYDVCEPCFLRYTKLTGQEEMFATGMDSPRRNGKPPVPLGAVSAGALRPPRGHSDGRQISGSERLIDRARRSMAAILGSHSSQVHNAQVHNL